MWYLRFVIFEQMNRQIIHSNKLIRWVVNFEPRFILHLLFWIAMYADEVFALFGITDEFENKMDFLFVVLPDIFIVYLNLYVLIPYLLNKKKTLLYLLLSLLSVVFVIACNYWLYIGAWCYEDCDNLGFILGTFSGTATLLGAAIGLKVFIDYIRNQNKLSLLQEEKHSAEINYLKEQMNPHFLFNALNSIYIKSKKKTDEVPNSILGLSDLLRYQLYECQEDFVSLTKEVDYLNNYMELELLRKDRFDYTFELKGEIKGKTIAPLIFLPFIENAVKHSHSMDGGFIKINLDIVDNNLSFKVLNSIADKQDFKVDVGGIGLNNVKKRLNMIYGGKHTLKIENSDKTYSIMLHLNDAI